MKKIWRLAWIAAVLALAAAAQQRPAPGRAEDPPQQEQGREAARTAPEFSAAVAEDLVERLSSALVRRNVRRFLSAFQAGRMAEWGHFRDQVEAYVGRRDFRVYYRIEETSSEGGRGVALVEFQLEESLRDGTAPPRRKRAQLRLEFERGPQGWKIVGLRPREFFS